MKQRGFTLVELMVVVSIIGILAAVAVAGYNTYAAKSKWGEVTPCITSTALNLENYRLNHGVYPVDDTWTAINRDAACSTHYSGGITVYDGGIHYVVAYCDRLKAIWSGGKNDVWVMSDTNPTPVHYRNSVEGSSEELGDLVIAQIPSECTPTW